MRVSRVAAHPIMDETGSRFVIVTVDTDEGLRGLGEIGVPMWGSAVERALAHLAHLVAGTDPWAVEHHWQRMFRASFFPADRVYLCALSAIDLALWDLRAQAAGVPLYRLLGGPVRDRVVCYPHVAGATTEALVEACTAAVARGWRFVRWDIAGPPVGFDECGTFDARDSVDRTVERLRAVREAVGPEIEICIDVHTRLDPHQALRLLDEVRPWRPFFVEDPLRSENPGSYRQLRARSSTPIAAGEQWTTRWGFREALEEELIDFARPDLALVGGITEALKVAHLAEVHHISIVPHNPLGPVCAAASVALCMAVSNVGVQEMPRAPGTYARDIVPEQVEWADGHARPRDVPGLGITFDETAARAHRWEPGGYPPEYRRPDGSITNW